MRRLLSVLALLGLLVGQPSLAASKKKADKPTPAGDPAFQSKALSLFMGAVAEYCRADADKGFPFPIYVFSSENKQYSLQATPFVPCGDIYPTLLLDGFASAIVLSTDVIPNYDTSHDGNVWSRQTASSEEADKASRQILGKPLVAKRVQDKNGYEIVFYNPDAFEAAFRKFYFKPVETRGGVVAQKLYDAVFKQTLADYADTFAKVMEKKKLFVERANQMLERAQNDESFYGNDFARQVGVELAGGKPGDDLEPLVDQYRLGTMLRRQMDGTLPVIVRSLKTVLKDYDPAAYAKYGSKL